MSIRYTMHLIFAATLPINLILNQWKGKNMDSILAHAQELAWARVILILFIGMVVLIATVIKVVIFCKISSKAGYSWALGLLMLVPIADIILPFFLAFADWPVQKELRKLKQQQNNTTG